MQLLLCIKVVWTYVHTSVPEQKLWETGGLIYPDLGPLQNTEFSWEGDNEETGREVQEIRS